VSRSSRTVIVVIVLALVAVSLHFLPMPSVTVKQPNIHVMGTFGQVIAVAPTQRLALRAIEEAQAALDAVDRAMSYHDPNSELNELNRRAFAEDVTVSPELFQVISRSIEFSRISDGAFDVTVGPLVDLWQHAKGVGKTPTPEEIAQAKSKIGYDKLMLDRETSRIRFTVEGMRIDLGGIAKGYGIDRAVEAMLDAGATGGMVEIGGDLRCFGAAPQGQEVWKIGVQRPAPPGEVHTGEYSMVLSFRDKAVATSGDYQRFILVEGKPYSHIINTRTGGGSHEFSSVSIIAPGCIDADALATSVSVMGLLKGTQMLDSLQDRPAILISPAPEYKCTYINGAEKYVTDGLADHL